VKHSSNHKKRSEDLYQQACKIIPGGVSRNTVFHKPYPHYAGTAKGCYVTDMDGVQRIDFANITASVPELVNLIFSKAGVRSHSNCANRTSASVASV